MDSISKPVSVIIIGAGISGISAAKTLNDKGIRDILILEGTSRIGGRMKKVNFGGQVVELGANWLHAGEGSHCSSPLLEAANKIKLNTILSDYSHVASHVYKQEGGLYEENEVEMAMDKALIVQELGAKLSVTNQETNQEDMSILDMQRLYKWMPTNPLEKLIDYYYYDYEDGEPPEATSLKHTLPRREFDDFGDAQNFIVDPRGFESLVHLFGKQFLTYTNEVVNDNIVKLNQVVSEIYYTDNGVTIKTEDGLIYEAKVCIVSVSLGVLQNNFIKFNPELPEWKRQAICEFSIASFTKIFLKFPYAFWPTGPGTEFFLYAHERRGYYPIWKHYENEMPESNILMVMTSGEESMRIEQQSDEETKIEAMEVLRKIYGDGVPEAEDILVSRWNSNKFYMGAFSNWPPNFTTHQHAQLQAPIGPVYFTGEHTSLEHFGCVEGAYYAGCATGKEVIKYLQQGV